MGSALATTLWLLLAPAVALWLCRNSRLAGILGPVVFAYLLGMLLPRTPLPVSEATTHLLRDLAIPLAIPLLLFTLDVRAWLKNAGATALSFGLSVISLLVMVPVMFLTLKNQLPMAAEIGGMLTGMFTGGAPNAAVVHRVLEAPAELFVQVNLFDILFGGSWFLILVSFGRPLYGWLLKPYEGERLQPAVTGDADQRSSRESLQSLGLAVIADILIFAVSAGGAILITGKPSVALVMMGLTTLAIGASFWSPLRAARWSYPLGFYLVLVFCCAIGSQVDAGQLSGGSMLIAVYVGSTLFGTVILHALLARLFNLDRDTVMITSTAAIYGPPFVPPVANAINNPAMLLSGLTTGLVGYALGNYLGIGMAIFLSNI